TGCGLGKIIKARSGRRVGRCRRTCTGGMKPMSDPATKSPPPPAAGTPGPGPETPPVALPTTLPLAERATPFIPPDGPFPREFGRYVLQKRLGGGGMGTVFLAFDTRLERQVALKIPHPHLLSDPLTLERFYREARSAARLCHPN